MKRIIACLALGLAALYPAQGKFDAVSVELTLDQNQFLPNEDMPVKVRVLNRSGQDLTLGKEQDWITFSIQGQQNSMVTKIGDMAVASEFTLHSAEAGRRPFNLGPFFEFHSPGRYTVTATVKIPQWNQQTTSNPVAFSIVDGVRVANVPEMVVGVPPLPGEEKQPPQLRKYLLEKISGAADSKLYARVLDAATGRTVRVLTLDKLLTFSEPEAQIDRFSNLHTLHQTGAQSFTHCVISPRGQLLERTTYDYTRTRPTLSMDASGMISVEGGVRRYTSRDIPPNN